MTAKSKTPRLDAFYAAVAKHGVDATVAKVAEKARRRRVAKANAARADFVARSIRRSVAV